MACAEWNGIIQKINIEILVHVHNTIRHLCKVEKM